ncbi:hepatitis A virus cellular receptor 1 homolog isoform 1-T1 [Fundulus diaphanus]
MKVLLLLLLLTVSGCDNISVVGQTGQNVTLTCRYNIKYYGVLGVCWGRGELPLNGCNNQLIGTGEYKEETRISSRYQLLGRLDEGDVSLMIQNLREEDAGRYGCRVGIPGWFNDEKHHVDLTVERGLPPSPPPETQTPTERPDSAGTTADLMTTENLLTSCTDSSTTAERQQEGSNLLVVLGCVLFLLVVLVTAGGLFIMARRWRQPKLPQQDQVHFSTTASTLQLQHQDSVVENVYQIDGGAEGGDYEVCP